MTDAESDSMPDAVLDAASGQKKPSAKRYLKMAASPKIFYFMLFYLTAVLVSGTLTQSELGIYGAQERYFSAWVTLAMDVIPLPGGRLTLLLMSMNLASKLLFDSRWKLKNMGVNIAHVGMLLLMFGSLLTAYFSIEGSMYIKEGGSSQYYADGEQMTLRVIETSTPAADHVVAFSGPYLYAGAELRHARYPGVIKILSYHRNVTLEASKQNQQSNWRALALEYVIVEKPMENENGKNVSAAIIEVSGFDDKSNGRYMIVKNHESEQIIQVQDQRFRLELGPRIYLLPNDVRFELIDFKAEYHPGTGTPSSYSSRLRILENGVQREALIEMNEPLRMHGHTFYQSSFEQDRGEEASILSVVKYYGRMFHYISSIVMCIGLGLHLILNYSTFLARLEHGAETDV